MALAIQTIRNARAVPFARQVRVPWRLAAAGVGAAVLMTTGAATAATHQAELAQTMEQGRQTMVSAGAWLSTATAQAFTMQCAHTAGR